MWYVVSFLTNAIILVFQIAGGRLLAPYLGTSVGVWAGLISVVLGGMALGYHLGGKFSGTTASPQRISSVLAFASATAFLAWGMRDMVPTIIASTPLPVTMAAVLIGGILFMPTVILLAALSPMIAKNLILRLEESGKVVGALNAIGTVGSIVGAIATSMLLIPFFGLNTILLAVPISLCVMALIVHRGISATTTGTLAIALVISLGINAAPTRADGFVADISTSYNRLFITEEPTYSNALALWTSPFGIQCLMPRTEDGTIEETELALPYQRAHESVLTFAFPEGPKRALFLGGCVQSFPRYILRAYPETIADVVEIDPGITDVAISHFGFVPSSFPTLTTIHADARVFVNSTREPYDFIHMDAFGSAGRVPFHVMTEEMFKRLSALLTDEGIVIVNIHGAYEGEGALFPSVYEKTARTVFSEVGVYQFTNIPFAPQNLVLVATKNRILPDTIISPENPAMVLVRVPMDPNVRTLTDNYAPVEGIVRETLRLPD